MRARHLVAIWCLGLVVSLQAAGAQAPGGTAAPPPAEPATESSPFVLMLHSYDFSSEWTVNMTRGVEGALEAAGHRLEVRSEFLDFRHQSGADFHNTLHALLKVKYAHLTPRLIITTDDSALEFLLEHRDLMGSTPVVFGGVNNDGLAARVPRAQVTGVREVFRLDAIVDATLRLRPGTRRVFLLTDDTLLGQSVRGSFREVMSRRAPGRLVELGMTELTFEQMMARIAGEPGPDDLVVASALVRDHTGRHFDRTLSLTRVASTSKAPVVAIGMTRDTAGVLAGTLDSGVQHGMRIGRLATQVLAGVSPSALPITEDDTTLLAFDDAQLTRWGISETALPSDAVVFNRPPSFYRANKTAIWLGLGFMVLQSLIIGGLIISVRQRRRAERGLASQAKELVAANEELESVNRSLVHEQEVRQRAEEHLRHAQKMDAVGRLAGGVAHDFNNLLTIIIGYCTLLREAHPDTPLQGEALEQIQRASEQAATLTQNLLAFSRRQVATTAVVDVVAALEGLAPMLRRFCGEQVTVTMLLDPRTGQVQLGEGQLEQVIINLVINARDAMPAGGRLSITVRSEVVEAPPPLAPDLPPGTYVRLTVTDTGIGMDAGTRARVFEPFFTTKTVGRGTGLGLAIVYGIVTQYGGRIGVASEPGAGTSFTVWLPATTRTAARGEDTGPRAGATGSGCVVLLVEDEPDLRRLARLVLQQGGYRVLEAGGGAEAVLVAAEHPGTIDLVLTDIVMPGEDGFTVARRLREARPGLAVAYMSGYVESSGHAVLPPGETPWLLRKPFLPDELLAHVQQALGRHPSVSRQA